jgi:hypothetical protein
MFFKNWKKEYLKLLDKTYKIWDIIEDSLIFNKDMTASEIRRLFKILNCISEKDLKTLIDFHEKNKTDEILSKDYKRTNRCKRLNVCVPLFIKEFKKLEKKGK